MIFSKIERSSKKKIMAIIYNNNFERPEEKPEAPKPRKRQERSWKGFAEPCSLEEDDEQSDD